MKNFKSGFVAPLILGIIALLVIGSGAYVYLAHPKIQSNTITENDNSPAPTLKNFNEEPSATSTPPTSKSSPVQTVQNPAQPLVSKNTATKPTVSITKPKPGSVFKVGDIVDFESSLSFQPTETPVYEWDFGDGSYHGRALGNAGKNYNHVYNQEGDYTVSLNGPFANIATVKVRVSNDAPHVAIQKLLTLSLDPNSPQSSVGAGQLSVEIMKLIATATVGDSGVANFYIRDFSTVPLQNVKIFEGGRFLSNATDDGLGHLHTDFAWNPITIPEGQSKVFTIVADVPASANGEIQIQVSGIENQTPKLFVNGVGTKSNVLTIR